MNIREGMRRIAVVLGVIGGLVGLVMAGVVVSGTIDDAWQHFQYSRLISSAAIQDKLGHLDWFAQHRYESDHLDIAEGGILRVHFGDGVGIENHRIYIATLEHIDSIETTDGTIVYRSKKSSAFRWIGSMLALLVFPVIGYLLPTRTAKLLVWVGDGFVKTTA